MEYACKTISVVCSLGGGGGGGGGGWQPGHFIFAGFA